MAGSSRSKGALELKAKLIPFTRDVVVPIQHFIHVEWVGGAVLLVAAIIALVWANSPLSGFYFDLIHDRLVLDIGFMRVEEDVHHFVNDGLMAIFFFVVGLELKREVLHGRLSEVRTATLPVVAAVGGMVVPALFYLAFNLDPATRPGWGIPVATDIAFALGVVGLVGRGIPSQVRLFLLALAIVDDLGAILVIAIVYTESVSGEALAWAGGLLVLILGMQRAGIRSIVAYWVAGAFFWAAILQSGIHATLAGVIMGAITPDTAAFPGREFVERAKALVGRVEQSLDDEDHERAQMAMGQLELITIETESPLERLERITHPWSAYVILPVFALVNAGVLIGAEAIGSAMSSSVTLGIFLGLAVGKPLGVLGFSFVAVKAGLAQLPERVQWSHVAGAGMLAGIGFTMSIFITDLAFGRGDLVNDAKIGILVASLVSGAAGYALLKVAATRSKGVDPGPLDDSPDA
jgi:NhaA family Na+:H+ antiporter